MLGAPIIVLFIIHSQYLQAGKAFVSIILPPSQNHTLPLAVLAPAHVDVRQHYFPNLEGGFVLQIGPRFAQAHHRLRHQPIHFSARRRIATERLHGPAAARARVQPFQPKVGGICMHAAEGVSHIFTIDFTDTFYFAPT